MTLTAHHSMHIIDKFSEIGLKLSAEKDVAKLLELILMESMKLTGSDAGSLYIKDQEGTSETGEPHLIFTYTQNNSMSFPFKAFKLPINMNSIAGACALTGDIFNFSDMSQTFDTLGFHHNKSFDESYGYTTCNMLTLPLQNYTNDIIGVMQLINKKKHPEHRFEPYATDVCEHTKPFDDLDVKLVSSLASQAAILIERSLLFQDIEHLLDSMIDTLVTALDQRDPITAGHSLRVSRYAMSLAKQVNLSHQGFFATCHFDEEAMRELRIASMLHDVGKIGVREYVLMKQSKLTEDSLKQIQWRYKYIAQCDLTWKPYLEKAYDVIVAVNQSGFLKDEDEALLTELSSQSFTDHSGLCIPLLEPHEHVNLSIKRGNLTAGERHEINDHVAHTYRILSRIDWTKNLRQVPRIASDHHEKLNGQGYPEGRDAAQLELRSRILAIADIFDALTAKDRPYKPAIPIDKSLAILQEEVARGSLDAELVQLFIESRAYEEVTL